MEFHGDIFLDKMCKKVCNTAKEVKSMNKAELIGKTAKGSDITKKIAGACVDSIIDGISSALAKGEKVSLVGFGTFAVRKRAARKARNPRTGAIINVAAKKVPVFRPGGELKNKVK